MVKGFRTITLSIATEGHGDEALSLWVSLSLIVKLFCQSMILPWAESLSPDLSLSLFQSRLAGLSLPELCLLPGMSEVPEVLGTGSSVTTSPRVLCGVVVLAFVLVFASRFCSLFAFLALAALIISFRSLAFFFSLA